MVCNNKNTVSFERRRIGGFTLIELLVAAASGVILVFCVGTLLAGGQKQWTQMNTRVNGEATVGGYVAARVFDSVCRKATWKTCVLSGNNDLTLYYYPSGSTASIPEKYAQFYINNNQLLVKYGSLKSGEWTPDTSVQTTSVVLASSVQSVQFSVQGKAVSMVLSFNAAAGLPPVSCTAVRNND